MAMNRAEVDQEARASAHREHSENMNFLEHLAEDAPYIKRELDRLMEQMNRRDTDYTETQEPF